MYKDFLIIVRPDDIALNLKIRLFKRDFGLMIKSKFLLNTLDLFYIMKNILQIIEDLVKKIIFQMKILFH